MITVPWKGTEKTYCTIIIVICVLVFYMSFFLSGSNPVIKFKYLPSSENITMTIVAVHRQTVSSTRSKQITAMNLNLKCSRYYVKPSGRGSLLLFHDQSKYTSFLSSYLFCISKYSKARYSPRKFARCLFYDNYLMFRIRGRFSLCWNPQLCTSAFPAAWHTPEAFWVAYVNSLSAIHRFAACTVLTST